MSTGSYIARTVFLAGILMFVAGMALGQPGPADPATGDNASANQQTPGFLPGLVNSVTPDFLGNLFKDLPVPGFVKALFGAG